MLVVQAVAVTRGITPKDGSANLGAQRVPNKNSKTGTSRKKSIEGSSSAMMIPTVITTVMKAASLRINRTIFSCGFATGVVKETVPRADDLADPRD
jgi:hypothetical protein